MKQLTHVALFFPLLSLWAGCASSASNSTDDEGDDDSESAPRVDASSNGSSGAPSVADAAGGRDGGPAPVPRPETSQEPVALGRAAGFAILASAGITNIPKSSIAGDVGLTPDAASNISGFNSPDDCPEVTGSVYVVDATGPACATVAPAVLSEAKADAQLAFADARAAARGTPQAISGDLNGLTLYPGLYESGSSLEISPGGVLYLDAEGDEDAVFVLRSATSITTESTSKVVLEGGAKAGNVYWTAGSAVTLGTNSTMKGTLVAATSISLLTGAHLDGRAITQGTSAEAITLDASTIVVPQQ